MENATEIDASLRVAQVTHDQQIKSEPSKHLPKAVIQEGKDITQQEKEQANIKVPEHMMDCLRLIVNEEKKDKAAHSASSPTE